MTPKQVFTREATGLVRSLGFTDQFLLSQCMMNPLVGFVLTPLYASFFFPGAYLPAVYILGAIPTLAMAAVYAIFSVSMPRSGGDYIWSTRILGPFFGCVQFVFMLVTIVMFTTYGPMTSTVGVGLTALLFSLGATTNNTGLIALSSAVVQPYTGWAISMLLLALATVIALTSLRIFMWVERVIYVFYYIGAALFIVLLLGTNPNITAAVFDHAMQVAGSSTTYGGIIQQAQASGFPTSGFSLENTLLAGIPWGFFLFSGFNWSTYLAGETRHVKSTMFRALIVSCLLEIALVVGMTLMAYNAFGIDFMNAVSYAQLSIPGALPTLASINMLLSLQNPVYAFVIGLLILLAFFSIIPAVVASLSRLVFASSFDRLLPYKMSEVNERFHTPHWSVLLVSLVFFCVGTLFWLAGVFTTVLNTGLVVPIGSSLPLIAGILFYFKRRDLFDQTLRGITKASTLIVLSAIGLATFVIYAFAEMVPIASGMYLGGSLPFAIELVIALLIIAVIIYVSSRVRVRRMGISFETLYREIPPE